MRRAPFLLCALLANWGLVACGTADGTSPSGAGDLSVLATLQRCPIIESYTANPGITGVGSSVDLHASATKTDTALSFLWFSANGTLSEASGPNSSFTCESVGVAVVTLVVTDGSCGDGAALPIDCVAVGSR